MVDPVQVILLVVIIVLTILLVVLGIQIFFILNEVKGTIKKANRVLDNADSITENIQGPLESLSSLLGGAKAGSLVTIAKFLKHLVGRDEVDEKRHRE